MRRVETSGINLGPCSRVTTVEALWVEIPKVQIDMAKSVRILVARSGVVVRAKTAF